MVIEHPQAKDHKEETRKKKKKTKATWKKRVTLYLKQSVPERLLWVLLIFNILFFFGQLYFAMVHAYAVVDGVYRAGVVAEIIIQKQDQVIQAQENQITLLKDLLISKEFELTSVKSERDEMLKSIATGIVPFFERLGYHVIFNAGRLYIPTSDLPDRPVMEKH